MNPIHPKTFWGYPIDQAQILVTTIHLAPDRDVKANEFYKIADGGYAFALRAVRAGERGDFAIAGEFFIFPDDPTPPFKAGEIAGCDLSNGCLVKKALLPFGPKQVDSLYEKLRRVADSRAKNRKIRIGFLLTAYTIAEVQSDLFVNTRKTVRLFTKGGML